MQDRFNQYCLEHLDLDGPEMRYYSSLPLCALDAVLSIRLHYDRQVVPAVKAICDRLGIPMLAENPAIIPPIGAGQTTVSEFVSKLQSLNLWSIDGLRSVIGNYKTAGGKQIYKADAFVQFIEILRRYNIETFQDLNALTNPYMLGMELRSIKGQKVAVDYFFMLAGEQNDVKVDMHLTNFAIRATGIGTLTTQQIKNLFISAAKYLSTDSRTMTPRHLDHIVWNWQRNQL